MPPAPHSAKPQTPHTAPPPAPTAPATPAKRRRKTYRCRILHGYHAEKVPPGDPAGDDVIYGPNDVFLSSRPLYKRWPEKFVLAEEFAPLSDKGVRLTRPGEDLEEEEWEDVEEDEATYHTPTMRQAEPREEVPAAAGPPQGIPPGGPQGITEDDKLKRRKALLTRLDDMTLAELKGYAEEEEIPLHGAHKKEDIIAKIRQAEIG